ncbi:MAG TPA: ribosome maturation factor RimP [Patescibacteria group bacterium]|nr:ribosome maturation factor RimP [Patescibacteria group bacterium]
MLRDEVLLQLSELLEALLAARGLELVELTHRYEGSNLYLRILVDHPEGGITMDECARLNYELGMVLDEKDLIQQRYTLEVSSPGTDRPLKLEKDFLRCLQRTARFFFSEPIEGKWETEGKILTVENGSVYVEVEDKAVAIPLSKINRAKQTTTMK